MDSLETTPTPFSTASNMTIGPSSYQAAMSNTNNDTSTMMGLNPATAQMMPPAARFPFNSAIAPTSVPFDSLNVTPFDGSHSGTFNIDSGKKKRGRPRKYSPDGNIALGLATTSVKSYAGHGDLSGTPDSEQPAKKMRGRPRGSGKKQMKALGAGAGGIGFTPHVITVQPGEDIASKILAFSQQGPRAVCILAANGSVSTATLRQRANSCGTVTFEGQFEIILLSGLFMCSENNGAQSRTGVLSVSIGGSDGLVLGGVVAGTLMASSQVQVILGSFIEDEKKPNSGTTMNSGSSAVPTQMINFGPPPPPAATASSPPSLAGSSESSDENGDNPLDRHPGIFNNQPMQNMQMYHQLWAGQTQQ